MNVNVLAVLVSLGICASSIGHAESLKDKAWKALVQMDHKRTMNTDFSATFYMDQKKADGEATVSVLQIYRRDKTDSLMILFTAPKTEKGKGYLRLKKNLWFYDAAIGKWERRTERESIGGSGSRRQDYDKSDYSKYYKIKKVKEAKLGRYQTYDMVLTAKPKSPVAYPNVRIWIDKSTSLPLKRIDKSASGRKMRTVYLPKWKELTIKGKVNAYPQNVLIFDEMLKGEKTILKVLNVKTKAVSAGMFTKAWLESRSR